MYLRSALAKSFPGNDQSPQTRTCGCVGFSAYPAATGFARKHSTDNESATMKSSKSVIQGYDGVACMDAKHQLIVEAEA